MQTSIGQPEKGREQVLPQVCIICKKVKYKVDKDKNRNVERLKKVKTLTAGKLEAACLKQLVCSFGRNMYLACIGICYKDAGLADIIIESGLVASGSVKGVMNEHHYNRAFRTHKIVSEAMQRLKFQQVLDSLTQKKKIHKLLHTHHEYGKIVEGYEFTKVMLMYDDFVRAESLANSNFTFLPAYIKMVELLLLFT